MDTISLRDEFQFESIYEVVAIGRRAEQPALGVLRRHFGTPHQ